MSDVQAAVETIQRARGWRPCDKHTGWLPPGWIDISPTERHNEGLCFVGWPDPLADTPEGDHEFMEIMRWAREQGFLWNTLPKRRYRAATLVDATCWQPDSPFLIGSGSHETEKEARLLALADALRKEGE